MYVATYPAVIRNIYIYQGTVSWAKRICMELEAKTWKRIETTNERNFYFSWIEE